MNINKEPTYSYFSQDANFVILTLFKDDVPLLSEVALKELRDALYEVQSNRDDWDTLSWDSKTAHLVSELADILMGEEEWARDLKNPALEAIKFLKIHVYDVYPFHDHCPD